MNTVQDDYVLLHMKKGFRCYPSFMDWLFNRAPRHAWSGGYLMTFLTIEDAANHQLVGERIMNLTALRTKRHLEEW